MKRRMVKSWRRRTPHGGFGVRAVVVWTVIFGDALGDLWSRDQTGPRTSVDVTRQVTPMQDVCSSTKRKEGPNGENRLRCGPRWSRRRGVSLRSLVPGKVASRRLSAECNDKSRNPGFWTGQAWQVMSPFPRQKPWGLLFCPRLTCSSLLAAAFRNAVSVFRDFAVA